MARRRAGTPVCRGILPNRMDECTEAGCDEPAAVMLYIPWDDDRPVCTAHARALARQDGVVAEPLPDAEGEWP